MFGQFNSGEMLPVKTIPVLLLLICVCGCSPQKNLANRLKSADRVVVTNAFEGLSISVTGADLSQIVQAIAMGKKENSNIDAAVGYKLQFYDQTQHLATITTSGGVFWIGSTPYSDSTDTISGLYRRLREETDLKKR